MPSPPKPTEAELAILRVIWQDGPSTVRHVRDLLNQSRPMLYTTVLKMLQIMTAKGLVRREEDGRTHIYHACLSEERTQRQLIRLVSQQSPWLNSLQRHQLQVLRQP